MNLTSINIGDNDLWNNWLYTVFHFQDLCVVSSGWKGGQTPPERDLLHAICYILITHMNYIPEMICPTIMNRL